MNKQVVFCFLIGVLYGCVSLNNSKWFPVDPFQVQKGDVALGDAYTNIMIMTNSKAFATLRGKVIGPHGVPLEKIGIRFYYQGKFVGKVVTAQDGSFYAQLYFSDVGASYFVDFVLDNERYQVLIPLAEGDLQQFKIYPRQTKFLEIVVVEKVNLYKETQTNISVVGALSMDISEDVLYFFQTTKRLEISLSDFSVSSFSGTHYQTSLASNTLITMITGWPKLVVSNRQTGFSREFIVTPSFFTPTNGFGYEYDSGNNERLVLLEKLANVWYIGVFDKWGNFQAQYRIPWEKKAWEKKGFAWMHCVGGDCYLLSRDNRILAIDENGKAFMIMNFPSEFTNVVLTYICYDQKRNCIWAFSEGQNALYKMGLMYP